MRLIIFFLILPTICLSQQTINARQFFALGLSSYEKADKPVGEKVNFPWIDQYKIRTESRDFDLDKQDYTLRIYPSTGKIRNAQKAYYEELKNAPDFEGQEVNCDLLLSLHTDWLSLFILNENKSIMDELVVVLNDKQTIYEGMVGTNDFNPQKLMKLQTEKSDIQIALNKITLELDLLLNKYNIQDQEIDFDDFATIETISIYLTNNSLSSIEFGIVDKETEHEKQLLMKEIDLESSENKQLIDFLQFKYSGPHTDLLQERLSIGLAFQISNSGDKKLKLQKLNIEKEELIRKSKRNIQEKQKKSNTLEKKLHSDLQAFYHFQKIMKEERKQLQNLSGKISQKEGISPIFLLDIEERYFSMKIKSLNKKDALLKDYLKYLHQSDQMCQPVFVNYLNP